MRTLSLPDQTGHIGEVLHTNGTNLYWDTAGGGGGGVVDTVTGVDPIFVDATDPANLLIGLNFDGTLYTNVAGELSVVGGVPALTSLVATTVVLPSTAAIIYNNGVGGVGATLTRGENGALGNIDGVAMVVGSRILVKDQVSQLQNGIYEVTQLGNAGAPYILTRTTDSDDTAELEDQIVVISAGTVNKGLIYTQTTNSVTVGTSAIVYQNITTLYVTQQATGTQVSGQLAFWTGTARQLSRGVSQAFWDNTNKRLGLGTSTPAQQLHITGAFRFPITSNSTTGVFYKDTNRFLHTFVLGGTNENLFLGRGAGNFTLAVGVTLNGNVGIGQNALAGLTTGVFNTVIGANAGQRITTGSHNNLFGLQAGNNLSTGQKNVYIGESAGYGGSGIGTNTGSENIAIGDTALYEITTGQRNTVVGIIAGLNISTGSDNTAIGYGAGNDIETGERATCLGTLSDRDTGGGILSDFIAIGYGAKATANNQMVIGSDTTNIDDIFVGRGYSQTIPTGSTIHATGGDGTDVAGGNLGFAGGIATGNANGGDIFFQTTVPGASGTTEQTLTEAMRIKGVDQRVLMSARFELTSASVASANDLTLTKANVFLITGNTQINAITTANWQAGSVISFIFSGTPTVKHDTAGGAGTARIFLAGSIDLVASANTTLTLAYDGTQWQEISRKTP